MLLRQTPDPSRATLSSYSREFQGVPGPEGYIIPPLGPRSALESPPSRMCRYVPGITSSSCQTLVSRISSRDHRPDLLRVGTSMDRKAESLAFRFMLQHPHHWWSRNPSKKWIRDSWVRKKWLLLLSRAERLSSELCRSSLYDHTHSTESEMKTHLSISRSPYFHFANRIWDSSAPLFGDWWEVI